MKVYIGPYRYRWVSYVHDRYMDKKYGVQWKESSTKFEHLLEKLEDGLQWLYNITINQIIDRRSDQKIKVRIDKYDTWSMDHTLAPIILPMLVQLKATKHGSPWVDDEDVPEELRSTNAKPKENEYDTDSNHHLRWDWVLGEMIWAFEQKARNDWESDYYSECVDDSSELLDGRFARFVDNEGFLAHQKRMTNGFKLFGKYYENLWD